MTRLCFAESPACVQHGPTPRMFLQSRAQECGTRFNMLPCRACFGAQEQPAEPVRMGNGCVAAACRFPGKAFAGSQMKSGRAPAPSTRPQDANQDSARRCNTRLLHVDVCLRAAACEPAQFGSLGPSSTDVVLCVVLPDGKVSGAAARERNSTWKCPHVARLPPRQRQRPGSASFRSQLRPRSSHGCCIRSPNTSESAMIAEAPPAAGGGLSFEPSGANALPEIQSARAA
eukprot:356188-Chlamydomonas_euryale.AAC.10